MKSIKKAIGLNLKMSRQQKNLTQEALAHIVGVDQSRISSWETGTNLPDPEYRKTLARILGKSEEKLFDIYASALQETDSTKYDDLLNTLEKLSHRFDELEERSKRLEAEKRDIESRQTPLDKVRSEIFWLIYKINDPKVLKYILNELEHAVSQENTKVQIKPAKSKT